MEIILNPLFKLSAIFSFFLFLRFFLQNAHKWFPFFPFVMKNGSVNKE
ncbi:MAG: hypothetical protein RQ990_04545 [Candidatus Hydrothermia bacterium]|nr:hypothetical protein [Candidatus Hydrothermia bacterium]